VKKTKVVHMFVESITAPRAEWQRWTERLCLYTDPPPALVSSVAWASDANTVTSVNVWETPGAVADFYVERVEAAIEAEGPPPHKPVRHGAPLAVYVRQSSST
jgi:hypothetical protein